MVAAVLLLVAVGALAHGALVIARAELETSTVRALALSERHEAREVLRRLGRAELADVAELVDSVPLWGRRAVEVGAAAEHDTVLIRRVTRELWWASLPDRPPAGQRPAEGALIWLLDPGDRVLALEAVVSVSEGAPVLGGGQIDASRWLGAHLSSEGASCTDALPSELLERALPAVTTLGPSPVAPSIGLLPFDSALARTATVLDSIGTPTPLESGGACFHAHVWNWGDPDRPGRPCGDHFVVGASRASVQVEGGAGQGMLIVAGDVRLGDGTRFHGVVLATGALEVEGGAVLTGAAVAVGGVRVAPDSRIHGSACWAMRAFRAARGVWSNRALLAEPLARAGPT